MAKRQKKPNLDQIASNTLALVLGGGRGTRLFPLTAERAKPAVPLGGRFRLVDIPLSNCIHSKINRVLVLTQFNSTSLHRHITHTYKFDNFSSGFVEILAAEQTMESGDWFQGTADAIRQHLKHIGNQFADNYLILAGDHLYRMDYREMLATHIENDADITVAVLPVTREAAKAFGVLKVQDDARIVEFQEKPTDDAVLDSLVTPQSVFDHFGLEAEGRDYLGSMGVYLFKADALADTLRRHPEWIDFGKDVIPGTMKDLRVFGHIFHGFWEDIGTVRSYYECSLDMVRLNPPFRFHDPGQPVYTRPRNLSGTRIHGATITDSFICEGCSIHGATINESIVGIRNQIRNGAIIERSILMGQDYYEEERHSDAPIPMGVGEGSHIARAIIDKNARIGRNVVIAGREDMADQDGDGWAVRDGIVCVLKDAVIPDGARIE